MVRVVHAADFHLDSAFGALSAEKARERRRESRYLVERLCNTVTRTGAELLLLAGDLFDGQHVYPETAEQLAQAFSSLETRVFIAPGNHDPWDGKSPYGSIQWPQNVHIFRGETVEAVELPACNAVVYGAAFTSPQQDGSPLRGFTAPQDGRVHIMVLHADALAAESRYGAITREDIAGSGLDYLALGHVHQYSGVQCSGGVHWAYPGCPEGRGFDESGVKGILSGTVDKGTVQMEFLPFCRRKYEILRLDVSGETPEAALLRALPAEAVNDIYRVVFTGESDERGVDLPGLQSRFQDACYALELRDETTLRRDIWARAGEDSLRGLFLRDMRRKLESAENDETRQRAERALRFGLAALDGRDI